MARFPDHVLGTSPPLTEVSRALRPRNAKRVSKMSPGAPGPETPKSLKKVSGTVRQVSGESPESVWRVFLECSGTFWRLFGAPGPEAPGDIFETFSAFRARRARETSVRGGLVPKSRLWLSCFFFFGPDEPTLNGGSVAIKKGPGHTSLKIH